MIYLITEDTASARQFWNKVFKTTIGKNNFTLVKFKQVTNKYGNIEKIAGNLALEYLVDEVIKNINLNENNAICIAFDRLEIDNRYFNSSNFIYKTIEKCQKHNINLYITNYYCFEEIYLSYTELINLYIQDSRNKDLLDTLKYVQYHILNRTDYFNINNKYIQKLISIKKDAALNKEHFANALLFQATYNIEHGLFEITKQRNKYSIVKCWTEDCSILQKENKIISTQQNYHCNNCKFCMKNCNTMEKLKHLEENSIIQFVNYPFSKLIKLT